MAQLQAVLHMHSNSSLTHTPATSPTASLTVPSPPLTFQSEALSATLPFRTATAAQAPSTQTGDGPHAHSQISPALRQHIHTTTNNNTDNRTSRNASLTNTRTFTKAHKHTHRCMAYCTYRDVHHHPQQQYSQTRINIMPNAGVKQCEQSPNIHTLCHSAHVPTQCLLCCSLRQLRLKLIYLLYICIYMKRKHTNKTQPKASRSCNTSRTFCSQVIRTHIHIQ